MTHLRKGIDSLGLWLWADRTGWRLLARGSGMCMLIKGWSVTTSEDLHPLSLSAEGTEAIVTAGSRISVNNRTTSAEVLVERGSEGRLIPEVFFLMIPPKWIFFGFRRTGLTLPSKSKASNDLIAQDEKVLMSCPFQSMVILM